MQGENPDSLSKRTAKHFIIPTYGGTNSGHSRIKKRKKEIVVMPELIDAHNKKEKVYLSYEYIPVDVSYGRMIRSCKEFCKVATVKL